MPNFLESSSKLEAKAILTKDGTQSRVYIDNENNFVQAYYHRYLSGKTKFDYESAYHLRHLKQVFYCNKILMTLFPNSFREWSFAGVNSNSEFGSKRKKVNGKEVYTNYDTLLAIKGLFDSHGLEFSMDFYDGNVIEDENKSQKYVDEVPKFMGDEKDVEKLQKLANFVFADLNEDQRKIRLAQIKKWSERILEIRKEEYEIKEEKIILKR